MKSFDAYQVLAAVTRKPDVPPLELAHYALGMVGEAGEIGSDSAMTEDDWIKELGDCFWYAAGVCSVLELSMQTTVDLGVQRNTTIHTLNNTLTTLLTSASVICECAKKSLFYGKDIPVGLIQEQVGVYLSCLLFLCRVGGYDPLDVCTKNIAKLEARFGGQFDAFRAINRDLEAEGKAIEGVVQ